MRKNPKDYKSSDFIVAVDFDETLTVARYVLELREGALDFLNTLRANGVKLILWTSRTDWQLKEAVDFMESKGFIFDRVNESYDNYTEFMFPKGTKPSPKVYADVYVDDATINPMHFNGSTYNFSFDSVLEYILKKKESMGL